MSENDIKITLIGSNLAEVGLEFIYEGETPECEGCKVFKVCNNLQSKKRYRIVGIRGSTVHKCNVHRDGVCAVEVIESPILALLPAGRAIVNSRILFESTCTCSECDNYELCCPEGIIEGEYYLISKVLGNAAGECEKKFRLKLVELSSI
ncbi:MAG: UPF0179 family protein [Methanogenium sp.]|nr:UPF0179 family protein [Methanogenium sp.]